MEVLIDAEYRAADVAGLPVEELLLFVMGQEECPGNTEVSVSFVDDETIAQLNEEYRGKRGPTDVLSFECDGMDDDWDDDFDFAPPEGAGAGADGAPEDADGMPFLLGDIIIAVDVVERQTAIFGTTFEGEMSMLLVHGALHLCGYDHIEDDEAEEMEAREAELLGAWAARRGLPMEAFGQLNGAAARVRGEH